MTNVRTFFAELTLFQWLALIAFIFSCISVINAFLSLKTRLRDWWGTQSKKAFEKRVRQLEKELDRITNFANRPKEFYQYLIEIGINVLLTVLAAVALFMFGVSIAIAPIPDPGVQGLFALFGMIVIGKAMATILDLSKLVKMVHNTQNFAIEIIKFKVDAAEKGYQLADDGKLMEFLKDIKTSALQRQIE